MVRMQLMNFKIFFVIFCFFIFGVKAEINIDQWEDSNKTYKDLIDEGFEVKAYDISKIETENGLNLLLFVTVLQKNKEVFECQEYQTLDSNMKTIDLSFVCRKIVQPYKIGIGT